MFLYCRKERRRSSPILSIKIRGAGDNVGVTCNFYRNVYNVSIQDHNLSDNLSVLLKDRAQ